MAADELCIRLASSRPLASRPPRLKETFSVDVAAAEAAPLAVPLAAPFAIASSRLDAVSIVAVRVELRSGAVGWGRHPCCHPSPTRTSRPRSRPAASLGALLDEVAGVLPGHAFASATAGVEMALIDAVANSIHIPLIPIVAPNEAAQLTAKYRGQGFQTLKLKVGKNLNSNMEVLKAIRFVHPDCSFILDANEGYTADQAIEVLDRLNEMGVTPVLFEQPVHRDDWEGVHDVSIVAMEKYKSRCCC
ncbi:hypothetical protein SETIT_9G327200v2 [Setaria italica]|uniref:Mandelate racemase/muconate lactonizing enzyme C-terminal domain-containing protein n=2 Tax=Setaria TaxID=4554 RepID=A0A368SNB0_SETIT|nr:hypothetical protein SETIT_9G327200v2 [Setaria italica]